MLFSSVCFFLAVVPATLARPTQVQQDVPLDEYYAALEKRSGLDMSAGNCDMTRAVMPPAPSAPALKAPGNGQLLQAVMVGRGTQNYTCDTTKPDSIPVLAGAVATLFDASCIASSYPSLLSLMPGIALAFPVPSGSPINMLGGHHWFSDSTTPYFDLNAGVEQYGTVATNGLTKQSTNAPSGPSIQTVGGKTSKPVSWLRLESKDPANGLKTVYRLNTAGGSPPTTCSGMPANFQVQYAAEYWFWG